jgi:hypothetical protein
MPPPKPDAATVDLLSIDEESSAKPTDEKAGELFIVDNSDSEWKGIGKFWVRSKLLTFVRTGGSEAWAYQSAASRMNLR